MPNYKAPTVHAVPSPINLDAEIKKIQDKLANIPWLELIYGRAFLLPGEGKEQGELSREPKVYSGQKQYTSAMPNNNITAQSFFFVTSPEGLNDYDNLNIKQKKEVDLSIIFWWQYDKVDATKDYIFLEEQKKDIEAQLYKCRSLEIESIIDDDARAVWAEFDITDLGNELLMYPCGAVRYNVNLSYISLCP